MPSSVYVVRGISKKGKSWVKKNLHCESWQKVMGGCAVEHRYVEDIQQGMIGDGLKFEKDFEIIS